MTYDSKGTIKEYVCAREISCKNAASFQFTSPQGLDQKIGNTCYSLEFRLWLLIITLLFGSKIKFVNTFNKRNADCFELKSEEKRSLLKIEKPIIQPTVNSFHDNLLLNISPAETRENNHFQYRTKIRI